MPQSAVDDSIGTLLVTFFDLPTLQGWEGTVSANTYNRVSEVDPLRGTVGCGVVPSLFFESATGSVVGTARDTVPAPSAQAGSIQSSLGIHNTDAKGTGQNVDVNVTLYDPSSGNPIGTVVSLTNIAPGELRVVDDLFSAAGVPTNVTHGDRLRGHARTRRPTRRRSKASSWTRTPTRSTRGTTR